MPLSQREHEIIWQARQHYFTLFFQALDELMPENPTPSQFVFTFALASKIVRDTIASHNPVPPASEPTDAQP